MKPQAREPDGGRWAFVVSGEDEGRRLDAFLRDRAELDFSRSFLQRLIEQGHVTVDGIPARPATRVRAGEAVEVTLPDPASGGLPAQDIPIDIVYDDADVIVVNKPRGLVVHPAPGHASGTLVNALLARYPDLGGINNLVRPGIVHRLDKDTTGLMVVAKHQAAQEALRRQILGRQVHRVYLALVHGGLGPDEGVIDAPLGRHPRDPLKMAVVREGRPSLTRFRVLERFGVATFVEVTLQTGRTHQIRVHFAAIGHPCVSDPQYGPKRPGLTVGGRTWNLPGQALHAWRLEFRQPTSGELLRFEQPLPADFQALLDALRAASPAVLR